MDKRIIIIIISIILILTGVICLIAGNSSIDYKDYVVTPDHTGIISTKLSVKERYKQEVIDKSLQYLSENNIALRNNLKINTSAIVESNECEGDTQFKLVKGVYKQVVDLVCADNDDNSSSEFSSYLFDAREKSPERLKKVSDGYIIISNINIISEEDEDGDFSEANDINIAKYDKEFNLVWSYDYLGHEEKYLYEDEEDDEADDEEEDDDEVVTDTLFTTYTDQMIETENKLFFLIEMWNSSDNYSTRLLILNKDGSLYKDHRFEEYMEHMVMVDKTMVALSNEYGIYRYNYQEDKLDSSNIEIEEDTSNKRLLGATEDGYLLITYTDYYTDEDDVERADGTNSLYLLDETLKVQKSLDLDKTIGIAKDESGIDYDDVKIMDNKVYISYNTTKYDKKEDATIMSYPGILIVDKDLNVISDIKYVEGIIKNNNEKMTIEELIDYYVLDNKLYVLLDFEDNGSEYDNYILIDKYDANGKELIDSYVRETYSIEELGDEYYFSDQEVLDFNEKEVVYYIIISKELEVGEGHDNRVVLKLSKVKL